jgi:hypothetical protein
LIDAAAQAEQGGHVAEDAPRTGQAGLEFAE